MNSNKMILEYLLENGYLEKDILVKSIEKSEKTGEKVLDLLIEEQAITFKQLAELYSREWGFELFSPEHNPINPDVVDSLPIEVIESNEIFPFYEVDGNELWVLMSDPTNDKLISQIHQLVQKNIRIFVAEKELIKNLIKKYYFLRKDQLSSEIYKGLDQSRLQSADMAEDLIREGIIRGASDIHIEPFSKWCRVRFRIDGLLYETNRCSLEVWKNLLTKLKVLAGCDIAEHRLPQDGSLQVQYQGRQVDLRLSAMPTIHGEKIVLRILDQQQFFYQLDELGFSQRQKSQLLVMLNSQHGMILVTGPTGSGKTTTLYSLIKGLYTNKLNFITIEDPVEFQMEGINQIQVNEKSGLSFASGLRSVLRQDPNVIMVGEIRDEETAAMATRAAITGHLVLSSIHTSNTVSTITRLMDMKVPVYLLSSALRGVISQRLVNCLCKHCRKERFLSLEEQKIMNLKENDYIAYEAKGCPMCHNSGYQGRVAVQEVLKINRTVREAIVAGKNYDEIRETALNEGLIPFNESIVLHILKGNVSIKDGLDVLKEEIEWNQ